MKKYIKLGENRCELPHCNCGWNIKIGGYQEEDLLELKKFINNQNTGRDGYSNTPTDTAGNIVVFGDFKYMTPKELEIKKMKDKRI